MIADLFTTPETVKEERERSDAAAAVCRQRCGFHPCTSRNGTRHAYAVMSSGVGTGGSGGSMNRGPRAPGAPSSGATEKF